MSASPLVSVVMPAYRTGAFIAEAIGSVLGQSMSDLELLVVDDCSPDDTVALARAAAGGDSRARIMVLEHNSGAAVTRNTAIRAARGRYIAFLDSDDLWYPDKLARQIAFMQTRGLAFAFGQYDVIAESGAPAGTRPVPEAISYAQLLRCCPIGCLTAIYDRERLGLVEMPDLRKRQDWATWLHITRRLGGVCGQNGALGAYRLRAGSLSRRKHRLFAPIWTMYRQDQQLGLPQATASIALYALNGVLRERVPGFIQRVGFL